MPQGLLDDLAAVPGVTIEPDMQLKDLTTLRLGGRPLTTVVCETRVGLARALEILDAASIPSLLVGGGSNLVVADGELDLIAVAARCTAVEIERRSGVVVADAGAALDDVVAQTVAVGLGGLECLSGIPGSAGATPVQNVGAYGAEISDCLRRVLLWDRERGESYWAQASELDLGYRYSNLKFTGRAVVLAIELQLTTDGLSQPLRFGALARALGATESGQRFPAGAVREEVLRLRRGKAMVLDPQDHDTWSAGSFFTNPIVSQEQADAVAEAVAATDGPEVAASMPRHPVAARARPAAGATVAAQPGARNQVKLSAAWLIERAGFERGYPGAGSPVRLSTKHTLALTNRGEATTSDLVALARTIRDGVLAAFGVELVPEPVWVGASLDAASDAPRA